MLREQKMVMYNQKNRNRLKDQSVKTHHTVLYMYACHAERAAHLLTREQKRQEPALHWVNTRQTCPEITAGPSGAVS